MAAIVRKASMPAAQKARVREALGYAETALAARERAGDPRSTISKRAVVQIYRDLLAERADLTEVTLGSLHGRLVEKTGFGRSLRESAAALTKALADIALVLRDYYSAPSVKARMPVRLELRTTGAAHVVPNETWARVPRRGSGASELLSTYGAAPAREAALQRPNVSALKRRAEAAAALHEHMMRVRRQSGSRPPFDVRAAREEGRRR